MRLKVQTYPVMMLDINLALQGVPFVSSDSVSAIIRAKHQGEQLQF